MVVQTTRRPASAMRRASAYMSVVLPPAPTSAVILGKATPPRSGKQGFKRPPLHGYPSRDRFFRWISRQVNAAGVTPEMRPATKGTRAYGTELFHDLGGQAGNGGVIQILREEYLLKPCGALDQLVLPYQIPRVLHGGLRLQKDFFRGNPSRRDAGAQAVPASWTDA